MYKRVKLSQCVGKNKAMTTLIVVTTFAMRTVSWTHRMIDKVMAPLHTEQGIWY